MVTVWYLYLLSTTLKHLFWGREAIILKLRCRPQLRMLMPASAEGPRISLTFEAPDSVLLLCY